MSSTSNAPTSSVKPSSTAKTHINRLPAPTLFVGPPSRNASQLSITRTATIDSNAKPVRDPLTRTKSALRQPFQPISAASVAKDSELAGGDFNDASYRQQQQQPQRQQQLRKPSERSVNTKWRELQNTMNEVELTAQSTTHVFGDSHAAALAELRRAQVELARAWGRGSGAGGGGDDGTTSNSEDNSRGGEQETSNLSARKPDGGGPNPSSSSTNGLEALEDNNKNRPPRPRADTNASIATASTALTDESRSTEGGSRGRRSYLEDETALDVKLASERRAANEAYFKQVDQGVREVVAKLEAVAEAMKGMEGETRSLWSEEEDEGLDSPGGGEGKGEGGE